MVSALAVAGLVLVLLGCSSSASTQFAIQNMTFLRFFYNVAKAVNAGDCTHDKQFGCAYSTIASAGCSTLCCGLCFVFCGFMLGLAGSSPQ